MFGWMKRRRAGTDLTPADVAAKLEAGTVTLVDVREPEEFRAGHIAGAVNLPLSRFDPARLPAGRPIVLHCLSGARSGRALGLCAGSTADVIGHMAGGIAAWARDGLPMRRPGAG
ncbi:rhodanese-like domain-containing protein [uncultured Alsobacter sp.]|uniref:rhodanese-like domain-containing protein n=1 Tax=uncultured Alsobacter sp. TaxID=1748258 RepID=UPI0025D9E86E|nr:rhodanese-like domain-containing protein [uncultured Alsobacter sp.]